MKRLLATVLGLAMVFIMAGEGSAGLNDGLVAYYPFNGNANDESGNGYNGKVNGATLTADRFGNSDSAYLFSGDAYIQTPVNSNILPISFSLWFQADNVTGERSVVDSDVSCQFGHSLIIGYGNGDGNLDIQYHNDSIDSGYTVHAGEWYHAVVNYSENIQLYINGILLVEKFYPSSAYDGSEFRFGKHNDGDPQWFIGKIDDVSFYNRSLSASEIQQIYKEGGGTCDYTDSDNDGVIDLLDKCPDTPSGSYTDKNGCPASGFYTQEQVNSIINTVLLWGDIDGDKKISLPEAIHALQVTSGITEPEIK